MEIGILVFTSQISHTLIKITVVVVIVIVVVVFVTILLLVLHLLLLAVVLRSSYDLCKVMKVVLKAMTCRKSCSFLSKGVVYNL